MFASNGKPVRVPVEPGASLFYDRQPFWGITAGVAQSVEQLICNQWVGGSIPLASSNHLRALAVDKGGVDNDNDRPFWRGSRVAKGIRL